MRVISIVIPVYRAVNTLPVLVEKLSLSLKSSLKEIVFVFDCGNPQSLEKIAQLCSEYHFVKGVELSRNYGQHNATICGIAQVSETDLIVTMDEDLQHLPEDIFVLIEKQLETDADVVYGKYINRSHSGFRNITSWIMQKLLVLGMPELHTDYTSFRLMKTSVAKKIVDMKNSYTFLDGYLSWITTNVVSVPVQHNESQSGESSYTIKKLIEHSINIFVTFSNLPIRLLTYVSIFIFFLSFSYSIYIVIAAMTIKNFQTGFPTIISFLGFGFGFILLGLGIIGEYIQRINLKTTNRPNFNIKKIID